ncbi:MAG: hypothetical protein JWN38_615 [Candidatus Saccharibacteria bacterium]|nr:hypothetical protein [Candidatus Saccharibacteria bacterium]
MKRSLRNTLIVTATTAAALALPGIAQASDSPSPQPTKPAHCLTPGDSSLSYSFNATSLEVSVKDGATLCKPLDLYLAHWHYDQPGQMFPQTLDHPVVHATLVSGSVLLTLRRACGQTDAYLSSPPEHLLAAGKNEPKFVSDLFKASGHPLTYVADAVDKCFPSTPPPVVTPPVTTPPVVTPPVVTPPVVVKIVVVPATPKKIVAYHTS